MLLQELKDCSDTEYDDFLQSLEKSNQTNILNVLHHVKENVLSSRTSSNNAISNITFNTGICHSRVYFKN